ncbi:hypothetical protein ACQY0O_008105 [Thecaphora frezii]
MASTSDRLAGPSSGSLGVRDRSVRKTSFGRPPLPSSGGGSSSSASQQTLAAHNAATKRHSLFGTEDRIVLDIGSRVSKFGFSGEEKPRIIVESVPLAQPSTSLQAAASIDALWDQNIELAPNEQARKDKQALLLARLMQLLRTAFLQHLMVDPKQRKVLVLENASMPTIVKEMICKVLLSNLQVPSVSFVPSHLMALVASGRITGLVVECGYHETSILPIYYGRPMTSSCLTTPRASRALNRRLRALLLHHARFLPTHSTVPASSALVSKQKVSNVPEALLNDDLLEHIKAKALITGPYEPAMGEATQISASASASSMAAGKAAFDPSTFGKSGGLPSSSSATQSSSNPFVAAEPRAPPSLNRLYQDLKQYDEAQDGPKMQALKTTYRPYSRATAMTVAVSGCLNTAASTAPSSTSSFVVEATPTGAIAIPGWIRDRAAEVLFESDGDDEASIVELAVDVIRKLPIDLRATMCESILVTGGTAMLPGLINRFRTQLEVELQRVETQQTAAPSGSRQGRASAATAPSPAQTSAEHTPAEDADSGSAVRGGMLHRRLAVLNDPWPRVSKQLGKSQGGSAPAFAANLLPFLGASLLGELQTASLSEITREAYDEALLAAEKLRKAATVRDASSNPEACTVRPMLGPGNRGSFVGVVGGLETGAFGALAAVSRHLLVGNQQARGAGGEGGLAGERGNGAGTGGGSKAKPGLRSPTNFGPLRSPPLP